MAKSAPIPPDEHERLAELAAYDVLDTDPEGAFDDLTRLASTLCEAPIALVSLVDSTRQWFKSRVGLDATETPRDIAFCSHAILSDDLFVVPDAANDERFHDNPLVKGDPNIRFYAGAPLVTSRGGRIGTLCVIDRVPRELSEARRAVLTTLAREVVAQLELRKKIRELELAQVASTTALESSRESRRMLSESESRIRLIGDHAPVGIYETNERGECRYTNPAWQRIAGLSSGEALGTGWQKAIHPDDRAAVLEEWTLGAAILRESGDEQAELRQEYRFFATDGSVRHVQTRSAALRDEDGKVIGLVGTVEDITARKLADQALRDSEERYRDIFENATDLIQAVAPDGAFLYVNRAWMETLGYAREDVARMTMDDILHPESREHCHLMMRRLLAGETVLKLEAVFVTRDGQNRIVEGNVSCRFEDGLPISTRGIFRDVTERKETEAALIRSHEEVRMREAAMRSMTNSALSGVITFDRNGAIESHNPAAEAILGYRSDELLGLPVRNLLPSSPEDFEQFRRRLVRKALGKVTELEVRRKDGSITPVEMALFEFETAQGKQLACYIRDVSQRKEVERMKQEFVATVSHELRTPLTSIRGSLDLLDGGVLGPLSKEATEVVTIARRNTERLIGLINDILDLERLETGKLDMTFAPVAVEDLLGESVDSVRAFAEHQQVRVIVEPADVSVFADRGRIVQVLVNLLSNAVKFSRAGSEVWVRACESDGEVAIEVEDHGRGIPARFLETIFDRFQQVESSDSRSKGGSGLGLAICRAIAEQHAGRILVTSEEGKGSTFTVRLPRWARPEQKPARPVSMVVATSRASREDWLRTALESNELSPVVCSDAGSALDALRSGASVAVVDLDDPIAPALLAAIRSDPALDEKQLIVLATDAPPDSSWLHGNTAVLLDASPDDLLAVIRRFVDGVASDDVILVEDDTELLSVLRRQLVTAGIKVRTATTGGEAIALVRASLPGIMVLDIGLPDIDGFSVVAILRQDDAARRLPLLVYTGRYLEERDRKRLTLGPTQFLTKARVTGNEFRRVVAQLLRGVEGEQA